MILYGSTTSPYVRHARIALAQSSCEWTFETADYAKSAQSSPMKRVPYFTDNDLSLTDSAVIIHFARSKAGLPYLQDIEDHELFATATTILDSAINLFILEISEGLKPTEGSINSDILGPNSKTMINRQQDRILSGLEAINKRTLSMSEPYTDGEIRTACMIDWGLFRNRFDIEGLDNLQQFMTSIRRWSLFTETAPSP